MSALRPAVLIAGSPRKSSRSRALLGRVENFLIAHGWQPTLFDLSTFPADALLGLSVPQLLAVTVLAALPTAQNVYLISGRYQVQHRLARDAVFVSTLASVPVIIAASTWLR